MTRDPAVRTAAVALVNGWGDPVALLALPPDDYSVAAAVVREADRMRAERDQAAADYLAQATASRVVDLLAKALRRGRG